MHCTLNYIYNPEQSIVYWTWPLKNGKFSTSNIVCVESRINCNRSGSAQVLSKQKDPLNDGLDYILKYLKCKYFTQQWKKCTWMW